MAEANDSGMYLCRSAVLATRLWRDISEAHAKGADISDDLIEKLAKRYGCHYAPSYALKPIQTMGGDELLLTDGVQKGWANQRLYDLYVSVGSP